MIRLFTVKVNSQIRGLAFIRKVLGKENKPFLVSSNSIIASENLSGRVSGENFGSLLKAIFTNPEGSQYEGVLFRRVPNFANPERSQFCQSGGVPNIGNPEGSQFCQSGGVPFLLTRRGPNFANPEGSQLCQPGRVPILPLRKGPNCCQSGGVLFCQSGGELFLPTRRSLVFANPEGYSFYKSGGALFC